MRLATISLDICNQNIDANLNKAKDFIAKAKKDDCDVIIFPEIFDIGFSSQVNKYLQESYDKTYKTLKSLAARGEINIIFGMAQKSENEKADNIAIVFDKFGNEVIKYKKIHPFSYAGEEKYFNAGNKTVVFNMNKVKCSIFICYDLRFPEIFRNVAKEVSLIFIVANWPSSRESQWASLLIARAIENQCFVVGVNRTGVNCIDNLNYSGCSMVVHPKGDILLKTKNNSEYDFCDIDISEVDKFRKEFPFLMDMKSLY